MLLAIRIQPVHPDAIVSWTRVVIKTTLRHRPAPGLASLEEIAKALFPYVQGL